MSCDDRPPEAGSSVKEAGTSTNSNREDGPWSTPFVETDTGTVPFKSGAVQATVVESSRVALTLTSAK